MSISNKIKICFKENFIPIVCVFIIALLFFSILAAQLSWPFNVDQGMFSFVGSVIVDGGIPYKDAWEIKGPVVHFIYAISEIIFGNNYFSIRIFDFVLVILSSFFLYKILSKKLAKRYAVFLVCIYGISFYPDNWASAQPDGWVAMTLPIILYMAIKDGGNISKKSAITIGILLCLISLIKPFYILFVFVIIADFLSKNINKKQIFDQLLFIFIGGASVFAIFVAYLLLNNALEDFIETFILFNLNTHKYVSIDGIEENRNTLFLFFIIYERVALSLLATIGLFCAIKNKSAKIYITWLLFSIICVTIQGKYLYYQFFIFIPVIFMMIGYLFNIVDSNFGKKGVIPLMLIIVLLALGNKNTVWYINQAFSYYSGDINKQKYYNKFPILGKDKGIFYSSINSIISVSNYLKKNSGDNDTIQIWGLDSSIYFLSGVKPATRFGHLYPFVVGSEKNRNKYKTEFMKKITISKPKYIILTDNDSNKLIKKSSKEHLEEFAKFKNFIENNYKIDKKFGDYEIYKR